MTQYPGYPPIQPSYYTPPINPRPTSVSVLAIFGIVWGILQLLCNIGSGVFLAMAEKLQAASGQPNPIVQSMQENSLILPLMLAVVLVRLVLSITLIAGSSGALALKPWGRMGMMIYSWGLIAVTVAEIVISLAITLPAMERAMPTDPGLRQAAMVQQYASVIIGPLIGLIYPVFVLVYMKKAHVMAAFAGQSVLAAPTAPGYIQPPYPPAGPHLG